MNIEQVEELINALVDIAEEKRKTNKLLEEINHNLTQIRGNM